MEDERIELYDGVFVSIPKDNNSTGRMLSFELDNEPSLSEGKRLFIFISALIIKIFSLNSE